MLDLEVPVVRCSENLPDPAAGEIFDRFGALCNCGRAPKDLGQAGVRESV